MNKAIKQRFIIWGALFLAVVPMVQWAWGVRTNDVELGQSGSYDNRTHITRTDGGELVFQDAFVSSASLSQLLGGVSSHSELTNLNSDDHPLYLTGSRHQAAHTSSLNSSLSIPVDVGGNGSLGAHTGDSNIHLPRNQAVEITGSWRFSGTPKIWQGLDFSAGGGAGDVSLNFENGENDARVQWSPATNRFNLNRGLSLAGNLQADGFIAGRLAELPQKMEEIHLAMNDNAATSTVTDAAGRWSPVFCESAGALNPNTDQHTTASVDGTTTGVMGRALKFEASQKNQIDLGETFGDAQLAAGHDFTIALWWRATSVTLPGYIFNKWCGTYNTASGVVGAQEGDAVYFRVHFTEGGSDRILFAYWPSGNNGVWRHYAITRQGTTIRIWRDGILSLTDTNAGNSANLAQHTTDAMFRHFTLGGRMNWNSVTGCMDDFRLYGHALSEGEIEALYRGRTGSASSQQVVTHVDGALSLGQLAVDGRVTSGVLQVSDGAYCDGSSWVTVSSSEAKTSVTTALGEDEWSKLDSVRVVEFAYKKRNPNRGRWLDPAGNVVSTESLTHARLMGNGDAMVLVKQGYRQDTRRFLEEPQARRQLGFIAEDLQGVDSRLSRGSGIAAMDIAAFNTALLKEVKRRTVELEARVRALEERK